MKHVIKLSFNSESPLNLTAIQLSFIRVFMWRRKRFRREIETYYWSGVKWKKNEKKIVYQSLFGGFVNANDAEISWESLSVTKSLNHCERFAVSIGSIVNTFIFFKKLNISVYLKCKIFEGLWRLLKWISFQKYWTFKVFKNARFFKFLKILSFPSI